MVGIRSRELCQAPIIASVIFTLAGVVSESLSFSTLQDLSPGFERETGTLVIKRALASVATAADLKNM